MFRVFSLLAFVGMLLPCIAFAGIEEGMKAFNRSDFQKAIKEFRPLAEKGHAEAAYRIGCLYDLGQGVNKNRDEAAKWYEVAVKEDHAFAQLNLGKYLILTKKNNPARGGISLVTKSAEQGVDIAQYFLGIIYSDGIGTNRNDSQAVKWFHRVAQKGYPDAQFYYASMLFKGYGVIQNQEEAIQWFIKSANQGFGRAQLALGYIYFEGEGVKPDYKKSYYWAYRALLNGTPHSNEFANSAKNHMQASMRYELSKKAKNDRENLKVLFNRIKPIYNQDKNEFLNEDIILKCP